MSRITKSERLPSCEINIGLLKELENYFINELPDVIYSKKEYLKYNYSITIEDNFASEMFGSIDEYYGTRFTDNTSRISLSLKITIGDIEDNYMREKNIEYPLTEEDMKTIKEIREAIPYMIIDMDFRPDYTKDSIKINYDGKNARAMVIAVYDAIIRIIEPYKNNNNLYNPRGFIDGILHFSLSTVFPSSSIILYIIGFKIIAIIIMSVFIILIIYLTLAKRTHPYFLFDSKKAEKYKRWNNWFIYNAAFIILVNLLIIILRKFNVF